ncbi:hypothetical protein ACEPAH_1372 [Sanghuangporus vaninii]
MATAILLHEMFELTLTKRHLEQLRHVQIPAERLAGSPWPAPPRASSPYDQPVQWSKQASTQIKEAPLSLSKPLNSSLNNASTRSFYLRSTVDWDIEMLAFLESAATYVRDTDKGLNFDVICGNILWGSPIHNEFYHTMFTEFPDIGQALLGTSQPFVMRSGRVLYEVPEGITINLHSTAKSYTTALDNHNGQSWHIQNNFDPVKAVPPVMPLISTWNHVDNGYQTNNSSPPHALPTEIDTQPGVSLHPRNFPYHYDHGSIFPEIYNASTTGPKVKIDLIQQLLDEAGPAAY